MYIYIHTEETLSTLNLVPTSKRGVKTPVIASDHLVTVTKHLRLDLAVHTKVHDTTYDKNLFGQARQIALPALMVTDEFY